MGYQAMEQMTFNLSQPRKISHETSLMETHQTLKKTCV